MTLTNPSKCRRIWPLDIELRPAAANRDIHAWYKASCLGTLSCIVLYTVYGLVFVRQHASILSSQMSLFLRFGMTALIRPDDPYLQAFIHQLGSAMFFGLTLGVLNALICMGLTLPLWSSGRLRRRDLLLLIAAFAVCTLLGFSTELPLESTAFGVLCPLAYVLPWMWIVRKGNNSPIHTRRWLMLTGLLCVPFVLMTFMQPSFLTIRDSMLGMPVARSLIKFYYSHTLLAADVIKSPAARDQNVIALSGDIDRIGPMPHGTLWIRSHDPCSIPEASFVVSREDLSCPSLVLNDDLPANTQGRIFGQYATIFDHNRFMRLGIGLFLFSGPLIIVAFLLVSWLGLGIERLSEKSRAAAIIGVIGYLALFIPAWHTSFLRLQVRAHPEQIREYLASGNEKKRYLVVATFPGALSAEDLKGMIREPSARIRINALIEAGERRDRALAPLMEEALTDPQVNVRTKACWALGRINSRQALLLLEKVLRNDPSWYVRGYAYSAIGEIRPEAKTIAEDF
jgi:hypothetical protein